MKSYLRNIFRKLSLVQKFSAAVIAMIVVIMVTVSGLIVHHQRSALKAEMDSNQRVVVRNLAKDSVEPLLLMDPLRLDDLIRTIIQTPGCVYASVLDRNRRIVAHTDRKLLGNTMALETQRRAAGEDPPREEYTRDIPGKQITEVVVPVSVGYETIGTVVAGFSLENSELAIESSIRNLKNYITVVMFLVMLIGIWGAFGLARLLATPMRRLKDKMELVQKGDLNVEVTNDYVLNCWDVHACRATGCPAYGKKRCWTIPNTACPDRAPKSDPLQKIQYCKNCIVYRDSCGDEIGELVEVFNQMVGDLRLNLRKLADANDEKCRLERLSMIGQVASGVAHEINNPLGGLKLCFNNMICTEMDESMKRQHVEVINAGIERIQIIVGQLLDFSKHAALTIAPISLNTILENVLKLSEYTITRQNIRIVKELAGGLPDVMADTNKLEQVFLNLLINAMQAIDGTGGVLTIKTRRERDFCAASVADTGRGIPPEILPKIFDPFFTTKDVGQGTGLGLSVSKAIIEQHKGEISVESSETGTIFIVRIPVVR